MIARALLVFALIVAADQASKRGIVHAFPSLGDGQIVIPGIFDLRYVQNMGAAWGMLQGKQVLLIACAVVALVWLATQLKRTFRTLPLGWFTWGLLAGGIAGNLIDRVWRGFVVDFLDFHCIRFPTFNVADAAISVGVACFVITQWMQERKLKRGAHTEPSACP